MDTGHPLYAFAYAHIFGASPSRCIVPLRGVTHAASELEAIWGRFFTAAPPRQRRSVRCPAGDCAAIAERGAIQRSEESVRALAVRYSISPTTVQKWRKRATVSDQPMGPAEPHSTVLSIEQEAMIVAFRRHSLLPLDDCLYALQPTIPGLTRSSLHRCLQRHGISRLPDMDGEAPAKKKFKAYPIGFFHIRCPAAFACKPREGTSLKCAAAKASSTCS